MPAGGGFLIKYRGKWVLKGLVSSGSSKHETCNVDLFTLYTQTEFFTDWIKNSVEKNLNIQNSMTNKNIIIKKDEISTKNVNSAVHQHRFSVSIWSFMAMFFFSKLSNLFFSFWALNKNNKKNYCKLAIVAKYFQRWFNPKFHIAIFL